jgi:hypothetical protein
MRSFKRTCAVLGLLLFCVAFAAAKPHFVAAPGDVEPIDETPSPLSPGPHPLGQLKPWLECISKSIGTTTAYFGFNNPTLDNIVVPVGANNQFVPNPINRSQTTNFLPGRSRYFPNYAFSVTFVNSATINWRLNGYEVEASSESAQCNTEWIRFQMIVDGQLSPTESQVDTLAIEAATQMAIEPAQIETDVNAAGLGKWQIIFNVSQLEDGSGVSPVFAVSELFGDNEKFTALIDRAIAIGLAPSNAEPLPTGLELEGTPVGGPESPSTEEPQIVAPGTTPSTSPGSPPSSNPTAPDTPSGTPSSTPSSTPSDSPTSPTDASTPSNSGFTLRDTVTFALVAAITLFFIFACTF